jgi:hypothetical protein
LIEQLRSENLRVLLLNGAEVIKEFRNSVRVDLKQHGEKLPGGYTIVVGRAERDVLLVGCTENLQSGWGGKKADVREAITSRLSEIISDSRQ